MPVIGVLSSWLIVARNATWRGSPTPPRSWRTRAPARAPSARRCRIDEDCAGHLAGFRIGDRPHPAFQPDPAPVLVSGPEAEAVGRQAFQLVSIALRISGRSSGWMYSPRRPRYSSGEKPTSRSIARLTKTTWPPAFITPTASVELSFINCRRSAVSWSSACAAASASSCARRALTSRTRGDDLHDLAASGVAHRIAPAPRPRPSAPPCACTR